MHMAKISKKELIALQKRLKTDAKIGAKYGITRQAVHQLRKKYGIDSRTANNPVRNKKIVSLRKSGKSTLAIAKQFDLSLPQTYRILKESGGTKRLKRK
jgi:DNA invertase Pin-like site-specific DNA recombinase